MGTDEIWKVVEREQWVYWVDVGTLAVCEKANGGAKKEGKE